MFKRKGWLRKEFDEKLVTKLTELKDVWMRQKQIVEKSVEPSEEVLCELKVEEAIYLFLLREAKLRKVNIGGPK